MRKLLSLFIFLSMIPIINADLGKTFELDFNINPSYSLWMNPSDRILFEYGRYNHTIILDKINANSVELDIFLFLEAGQHNPDYGFLGEGFNLKIDFDRDKGKELQMDLVSIDKENKRINLIFTKLDAWDENIKLKPPLKKEDNINQNNNQIFFIIGGFIFLILIIILVLFKTFKERGIYF